MLTAAVEPARLSADLAETLRGALDPVEGLTESLKQQTRAFEAELSRSLQPMTDYADQLERNLDRLVSRLGEAALTPGTPVARQVEAERTRLLSVRAAIEEAKEPLRAVLRREVSAVDAVLAPFEPDIESFEALLRQQRRHLVRVVSGLQSEPFHDALDVLRRRRDCLRTLAVLGETDPIEVAAALEMDAAEDGEHTKSRYLAAAIAALTAPDDRDADAGERRSPPAA
jgi:phytoene dehydrogenase-like protein